MPVSCSLIRENPCHPWFYEIFSKEQEIRRKQYKREAAETSSLGAV